MFLKFSTPSPKLFLYTIYLCNFQEFCHPVHSDEKLFIQVQGIPRLLLAHVKIFLEKIDNPIVVTSKEPDQISEEQHKAGVDDSIIQILKLKL